MDKRIEEIDEGGIRGSIMLAEGGIEVVTHSITDILYLLQRIKELKEENERLEAELEAKTGLLMLSEAEVDRLRGESPDAGGKNLQRGKRHLDQ